MRRFSAWIADAAKQMRDALCEVFGHAQSWNLDQPATTCPRCGRPMKQEKYA